MGNLNRAAINIDTFRSCVKHVFFWSKLLVYHKHCALPFLDSKECWFDQLIIVRYDVIWPCLHASICLLTNLSLTVRGHWLLMSKTFIQLYHCPISWSSPLFHKNSQRGFGDCHAIFTWTDKFLPATSFLLNVIFLLRSSFSAKWSKRKMLSKSP